MSGATPPLSQIPVLYLHSSVAFIDHSRNWNLCNLLCQLPSNDDRDLTTRSVKFLFNYQLTVLTLCFGVAYKDMIAMP